jgi:hypothetical protein
LCTTVIIFALLIELRRVVAAAGFAPTHKIL